jgi:hypothetical protein
MKKECRSVALLKFVLARPSIQNRGCVWVSVKPVWTCLNMFGIVDSQLCLNTFSIFYNLFSNTFNNISVFFHDYIWFFCVIFQTKQITEKETLECWKYKQEHRPPRKDYTPLHRPSPQFFFYFNFYFICTWYKKRLYPSDYIYLSCKHICLYDHHS